MSKAPGSRSGVTGSRIRSSSSQRDCVSSAVQATCWQQTNTGKSSLARGVPNWQESPKMTRCIVLVSLPPQEGGEHPPALGHESLLASLRNQKDLETVSVVCAVGKDSHRSGDVVQRVLDAVGQKEHADTDIAIGAYVWNDTVVTGLIRSLREREFSGRIVLGGPQISYAESGLERMYPEADAFIRGQAESALCQFAVASGRPGIIGVHYAGTDDRGEQAISSFAESPSPWLADDACLVRGAQIHWETQRGCKFRCSFCQHRLSGADTPLFNANPDRIDLEIDLFCRVGVSRVSVLDPVFNMDQNRAVRILKRFSTNGFNGELSLQCRAELITDSFLEAAQDLDVTLEFGLQTIHEREYLAVGRNNNMGVVEKVLRKVLQRGIRLEVSLIYGLPGQTLSSFEASVRWCRDAGIQTIKAFPLLLLRGTALERDRERWSLETLDGELPIVIRSNSFDTDDWKAMNELASRLSSSDQDSVNETEEFNAMRYSQQIAMAGATRRSLGRTL